MNLFSCWNPPCGPPALLILAPALVFQDPALLFQGAVGPELPMLILEESLGLSLESSSPADPKHLSHTETDPKWQLKSLCRGHGSRATHPELSRCALPAQSHSWSWHSPLGITELSGLEKNL